MNPPAATSTAKKILKEPKPLELLDFNQLRKHARQIAADLEAIKADLARMKARYPGPPEGDQTDSQ